MIDKKLAVKYVGLLNKALSMEYAAAIQYGIHTEQISGPNAEPLMARLKDDQHDEEKHADILRNLIGDFLLAVPGSTVAEIKDAKTDISDILNVNILTENEAIDTYLDILDQLADDKDKLKPIYAKLEHDIRHILMEEQEHVAELERLK